MKKSCKHNALLQSLMDGELSDEKKRFMEHHLTLCDQCQEDHASLRKLSDLLGQIDDIELSSGFDRSFWKKVDDYDKNRLSAFFGGRVTGRWRMVLAPLLVTLVLISGIFFTKKAFTPFTMSYDEIILVSHIEFLHDLDIVNNLDMNENKDVLSQMKEAS
jgi:hypothetical protein